MFIRKKGALVLSLIFITILFLGYGHYRFSTDKPQVRIAVSKTPLSAPFYIADSLGFFNESCVEVVFDEVIGGGKSFDRVMDGYADFATSSGSVIVFKALKRNDFVSFATFVQSNNDVKFVTRVNAEVISGKDLSGKKIGLTKDAAGDYFLSIYLAMADVATDNVSLFYFSADQLEQALVENIVDLIVTWEPFGYKTIQSLKGTGKILPSKNIYTLSFNLIAKKNYYESNLNNAVCVLNALEQATEYIASHPFESQQVLLERLDLSPEFIGWVWSDYVFKLSLNNSLLMDLNSQANWAIKRGDFNNNELPDFKQLIDQRALIRVNPMAVSL